MIEITNLETAFSTLQKCYLDYQENQSSPLLEYISDSCVKRFEYTLEVAWKLMKKILIKTYEKNEQELTMNNIFRFMQGYGYASNWETWRNYYQQRNNTAHEYNIEKSRQLIKIVPDFINDIEFLLAKLRSEQGDN